MSEEIVKVSTGQVDLDKSEDRQAVHDANIAAARKANPNNPLYAPFRNETGIVNLGHGSFSGVNVRDLKGNVVTGTTQDSKAEDTRLRFDGLPLLRYINLPGGSIELKIYRYGMIKASKTIDGINFIHLASGTAIDVLQAISERACVTQPVREKGFGQVVADEVFEYDKLNKVNADTSKEIVAGLGVSPDYFKKAYDKSVANENKRQEVRSQVIGTLSEVGHWPSGIEHILDEDKEKIEGET
jgi:hypothetical protein